MFSLFLFVYSDFNFILIFFLWEGDKEDELVLADRWRLSEKVGRKKYTLKYTACKILNHKKTGETDNLSMLTSESRPAFLCMIHFDFIFP